MMALINTTIGCIYRCVYIQFCKNSWFLCVDISQCQGNFRFFNNRILKGGWEFNFCNFTLGTATHQKKTSLAVLFTVCTLNHHFFELIFFSKFYYFFHNCIFNFASLFFSKVWMLKLFYMPKIGFPAFQRCWICSRKNWLSNHGTWCDLMGLEFGFIHLWVQLT